jgi:DNA processing protein
MSLLHQLALSFLPDAGHITAKALLSYCGNPEEIFKAKRTKLEMVPAIRSGAINAILNKQSFDRAEQELKFIEKHHIKTFFYTDPDYPARLKSCYDAPVLLYYKGNADLNKARMVSVVGTRKATEYGKELSAALVKGLKVHDPVIISGLAHGIDGCVHKECVKNEIPTVGVLGHGLDRIFPVAHRQLAANMLPDGGLLTEFPSETIPNRENFPKRNRIIAGLSDVTIVVEANIKGGALITAEIANSYNRDVLAFPGRTNDEFSQGCNYLIKTNRAHLISSIADLEYLLGWNEVQPLKNQPQLSMLLDLSGDEQKIADILREKGTTGIDQLAISTQLPLSKLAISILEMEMKGYVVALPGKTYKLG